MKKMNLKKKRKKGNFIVIIIVLIFIGIWVTFKIINDKITPVFLDYATLQAGKIATFIINQAVNKEITDELNIDELFITSKDADGKINSVDFNPKTVNRMLNLITSKVNEYLDALENGNISELNINNNLLSDDSKLKKGIIFEIPSGLVFNNVLLSNIGPKIPVKLNLVGDITSNISTSVTDYGINNALIEIIVNIKVYEQVILPYTSKQIEVEIDIPIAIKLLQGETPSYYYNGLNSNLITPNVD